MSPDQLIYVYISPSFILFTCLTVFISIKALSRIKDALLFTYLKLEMIFILADCLIDSFTFLTSCEKCFPSLNPYLLCIYTFFGLNFISAVFETASLIISILAALSCLFVIDSGSNSTRFKTYFFKLNPNIAALFAFVFSIFTFSYEFFTPVPDYPPRDNSSKYNCVWSESFQSPLNQVFVIVSFIISYGLLVIVLIFINGFIVFKVRKNLGNKRLTIDKTSIARRKTKEHKLTKLIILDCCNFITGRFPTLVVFLAGCFVNINSAKSFPFISLSTFTIFLSYNIKFLIFYKVNSKFRTESKRIVSSTVNWVFKCRRSTLLS